MFGMAVYILACFCVVYIYHSWAVLQCDAEVRHFYQQATNNIVTYLSLVILFTKTLSTMSFDLMSLASYILHLIDNLALHFVCDQHCL